MATGAGYGTTHRATTPQPSSAVNQETEQPKAPVEFKIICPFSIPPTRESAADRMIKNLDSLRLYYFEFFFIVLFITLIPEREVSLIILVAAKEIAILYLLLIRSVPILNNFIDWRVVFFLLAVTTSVLLILTRSAVHLLATFGSVTPFILVHAATWKREDVVVGGGDDGGAFPLTHDDESRSLI